MKESTGKFEKTPPKSKKKSSEEKLKEENEVLKTENFLRSFIAEGHSVDTLTELKRREILEGELKQSLKIIRGEIHEHRKGTEPLKEVSLIFMDIDNFKTINDRHGHSAGDEVIQKIAAVLTGSVRGSDMVARWGGEEFVVLLRGAGIAIAAKEAENLRAKIEQLTFDTYPNRVTASFGVVSSESSQDDRVLVELADQATYAAKQGGKNRVNVHEEK